MSDRKVMNRWLVVVGAIMIQLCLGAIYAWSVFTKPLVDMGWTKTETQAVFSAGLALFAVVMVIAGRVMPTIGPRKLTIAGGIVLGLGYILAGWFATSAMLQLVTIGLAAGLIIAGIKVALKPGTRRDLLMGGVAGIAIAALIALPQYLGSQFAGIFLFVGVLGGSGIGLAYVVPIAVGIRWFPDKKGLITGLAVAGFGFGAMLWVKLAGTWGNFLTYWGLSATFVIYGIIFLAAVVIGGIWMVFPPEGWKPEGYEPPRAKEGEAPLAGTVDFSAGEMLRTPQFYMIFLTFLFGAGAGLMSIGLMKLFPSQALAEAGFSPAEASATAGTAMAVYFSLANGLGRIAWGAISDKLGRKWSLVLMYATQGVVVILFQWMAGVPALLFVGAAIIGFNFGGNFSLFPTMTADTFGTKYVGQNYGWVFLSYGVGGIFGPILGGRLGDLGQFPLAFSITGVMVLVAAAIIFFVKPATKKVSQPDAAA